MSTSPVGKPESLEKGMGGFFNMADRAKKKVNEKRKKKGLGEQVPREHAVSTQYVQYGVSAFLAKTMLFPLERVKVLA